jgi:molybdopterin converting factor small subunit
VKGFARVRLLGSLSNVCGTKLGEQSLETPISLREILDKLKSAYGIDLRRDSTLILVNGVEANALQDLETLINSGDLVAFIPMFHGG